MTLFNSRDLPAPKTIDFGAWPMRISNWISRFRADRAARQALNADIRYLRQLEPYRLKEIGIDVRALMSETPVIRSADCAGDETEIVAELMNSCARSKSDLSAPDFLRGQIFVVPARNYKR